MTPGQAAAITFALMFMIFVVYAILMEREDRKDASRKDDHQ